MIFQVHQPVFPLGNFIDHLIYFEGFNPAHSLDRFLPDGNTELIIDLTEIPQNIHDNNTLEVVQTCSKAWVSGVRTRPITIPSGKGGRLMIIAFKKGAAHPFYPFPMTELMNSVVMADLVFGKSILDLRENLLYARSTQEMFHLVEVFLFRKAGDNLYKNTSFNCIKYAITSIISQPTILNFHSLSDQIGYSQKHFIDLFKGQVGLSPKQYLKIMRFQKAIQEIEANHSINWSNLAAETGFYDQAHFINDFKNFSGFTPNEYILRKAGALNYVPVN
jgi:AraC-like DNA-binding protein